MRPMSRVLAVAGLVLLCGCGSVKQIRIENASSRAFTHVKVADQDYGDIAPGETTEYRDVKLGFRYAALELRVDGKYVTGQTLNLGSKRFTYRIDVKDFDAGHLAIDVVRDNIRIPESTVEHAD